MTTTKHIDETAVTQLLALLDIGSTRHTLRPLPGSSSNITEVLEYETAGNQTRRLVLHHYAPSPHYDQGEKAAREFKTLTLLAAHHIPIPQPLLLDQNGTHLGTPGIVTSFVPGRQTLPPPDPSPWLHELATTLARL